MAGASIGSASCRPSATAESQADGRGASPARDASSMRTVRLASDAGRARTPTPDRSTPAGWGHLVLLETVGQGAFGTVYRAWDAQLDREVALKVLLQVPLAVAARGSAPPCPRPPPERRRRLRRRAGRTSRSASGWSSSKARRWPRSFGERGPMSAREVAGIGIDLCRALSALHRSGLLHGDIKAQNVMREVGGRIVLMDFSGVQAPTRTRLASSPARRRTSRPSCSRGAAPPLRRDIYSLGDAAVLPAVGPLPGRGRGRRGDPAPARAAANASACGTSGPELPGAAGADRRACHGRRSGRAVSHRRRARARTRRHLRRTRRTDCRAAPSAGRRSRRARWWVCRDRGRVALAGSSPTWRCVPPGRAVPGPARSPVDRTAATIPAPGRVCLPTAADRVRDDHRGPEGSVAASARFAARPGDSRPPRRRRRRSGRPIRADIGFFGDGKLKTVDIATEHDRNDCRCAGAARRSLEC